MSEGKRGKKRPKSYYKKCAGGKRQKGINELDPGMKGFLVTCNKYEKETVREMYNLLNEYADKLYGPEQIQKPEAEVDSDDEDEDDIEKALAKERSELVTLTKTERRFQNTDTKFKNLIFIRTTLDDPCTLGHHIFNEMFDTQTKKARYAQRLIPVNAVCKAQTKSIDDTMKTVLEPHFTTPFGVGLKYTNLCKIRNNQTLSRSVILPMINRHILEMNPLHRLCHDEPELVVIVEVIRNLCCIGVVKDYFKFKKYNFHEIIKQTSDSAEQEDKNSENDEETAVDQTDKSVDVGKDTVVGPEDGNNDEKEMDEERGVDLEKGDIIDTDNVTPSDKNESNIVDEKMATDELKNIENENKTEEVTADNAVVEDQTMEKIVTSVDDNIPGNDIGKGNTLESKRESKSTVLVEEASVTATT